MKADKVTTLCVKIKPNASRAGIVAHSDSVITIALREPPVDGKANAALIELLHSVLKVPKKDVTIVRGTTGRLKIVRIDNLDTAEVFKILANVKPL